MNNPNYINYIINNKKRDHIKKIMQSRFVLTFCFLLALEIPVDPRDLVFDIFVKLVFDYVVFIIRAVDMYF